MSKLYESRGGVVHGPLLREDDIQPLSLVTRKLDAPDNRFTELTTLETKLKSEPIIPTSTKPFVQHHGETILPLSDSSKLSHVKTKQGNTSYLLFYSDWLYFCQMNFRFKSQIYNNSSLIETEYPLKKKIIQTYDDTDLKV